MAPLLLLPCFCAAGPFCMCPDKLGTTRGAALNAAIKIEKQVTKAIDAIVGKKPLRSAIAVSALSKFDPNDVVAELSIQVDEILDDADRDAVLAAADLPEAWGDRHRILGAVQANDHAAMFAALDIEQGPRPRLYPPLFTLAAALKVARAKI